MYYIDKYLEYLKIIRKYSDKTIESYKNDLIEYNEFLGNNFNHILTINKNIVNKYLKYLYERELNKNSICRKLSSVRGLYNYLLKEEVISNNLFNNISNPKKELYLPKFLNEEEMNKLFEACNVNNPIAQRDKLILELLYATGLRVSELVNIKIKDIDINEKVIKFLGKGNK
jgi:integrase/recombinase XerC